MADTPEKQEEGKDAGTPSAPNRKRRLITFAIVLVVAVGVTLGGLWYMEEIVSATQLRIWDKGYAAAVVDDWKAALEANDQEAFGAVAMPQNGLVVEDGEIVAIASAQSSTPVAALIPASGSEAAEVSYDLRKLKRCARVTVPSKAGGEVTLIVVPEDGKLMVATFGTVGADLTGAETEGAEASAGSE